MWTGLALGQPPLPRRWLLLLMLLEEEEDGSSIWTPSPHRSLLPRMLVPVLVAVGVGGTIPPSDDGGGGEPPRTDEDTIVSSSLLVLSLRIAPFFVFLGAVPPALAGVLVCGPVRLGCLLLLPFAALALALDLVLALDFAPLLDLEAGFLIMIGG